MKAALPPYLASLNPEQLAAVRHEGRALLILAGAGSGKTRVITTKVAWLVRERGFAPEAILAVTFTNKAAREMRDRAASIEPACSRAVMRTFHSFGAWFLRRNAQAAGLERDFTIYDDDDQTTLLRAALPQYDRAECGRLAQAISRAKDFGLEPDSPDLRKASSDARFRRIYALYEERLRGTGNLDFGDLIRLPARLLRDDPAVALRTRQRFRVILVDEYQDSNVAQFELLRLLAGRGGPADADGAVTAGDAGTPDGGPSPAAEAAYVCVVGDDDQSIYRFRGAEVRNILDFPRLSGGADIIRLERNYRSFQSILDVAGQVVSHNAGRLGKTLVADRAGGARPRFSLLGDQEEEAAWCARLCEARVKAGGRWSDVAVLYRTNAQSLSFEKELPRRGIPYRIVGALRFYEREEVKDALAWLALVANPRDEVAFRRVVNKPSRGIGETSVEAIFETAGGTDLLARAAAAQDGLKGKARAGVADFLAIARSLAAVLDAPRAGTAAVDVTSPNAPVADALPAAPTAGETVPSVRSRKSARADKPERGLDLVVERLVKESGLLAYHRGQDEVAGTQRAANLDELVNAASLYPRGREGLADFLEAVELDRSLASDEEVRDAVTLITMHNTKGLEFPVVVVTGLEQGLFPREEEEGEDLEEQRRLFYVAVTRARDELHLTACRRRLLRGRWFETLPSRFLREIDSDLLEPAPGRQSLGRHDLGRDDSGREGRTGDARAGVAARGPAPGEAEPWRAGTAVYHEDYGAGVVVKVKPTPNSGPLLVVRFETGREAQFFPAYTTKLERQR